jgi:hypothetical protein
MLRQLRRIYIEIRQADFGIWSQRHESAVMHLGITRSLIKHFRFPACCQMAMRIITFDLDSDSTCSMALTKLSVRCFYESQIKHLFAQINRAWKYGLPLTSALFCFPMTDVREHCGATKTFWYRRKVCFHWIDANFSRNLQFKLLPKLISTDTAETRSALDVSHFRRQDSKSYRV